MRVLVIVNNVLTGTSTALVVENSSIEDVVNEFYKDMYNLNE